jgi:hypothetical protein
VGRTRCVWIVLRQCANRVKISFPLVGSELDLAW